MKINNKMEEGKRLNSEKKIDNGFFNVKFGTTNKKFPKAVYIDCSTYITPTFDSDNYEKNIYDIRHKFKTDIRKRLMCNSIYDKDYIMDFQLASNCMTKSKRSFLSLQIILKQRNNEIYDFKLLKDKSENFIKILMDKFAFDITTSDFEIFKTKH